MVAGRTDTIEGRAFIQGWMASEEAAQDVIAVKRLYIDINEGSLHDGLIFSQIVYWHGRNKENGKPRLTIRKDGHYWLAKTYQDWWDECRVCESTARKCISRLKKRGLIHTRLYKFKGTPTVHIRLDWSAFEACIRGMIGFDTTGQMEMTPDDRSYTETFPQTLNLSHSHSQVARCREDEHSTKKEEEHEQEKENQEPVESNSRSLSKKQSDYRSKRESSDETNTAPAAKKSPPKRKRSNPSKKTSAIVESARPHEVRFKKNDLGWVQMPKSKRYRLHRAIVMRRMQYQLVMTFPDVRFSVNENNQRMIEGNQAYIFYAGKNTPEDELCGEFNRLNFRDLRDFVFQERFLPQDAINELLVEIFLDTIEWCQQHSSDATYLLQKHSMSQLFYDADADRLNGILDQESLDNTTV